ncbi:MAG TPA: class I SAM-dependent methyltransferase [Opitutaceae bacterium]|nr:class I SAM-dependent methyltransferase [Opitutaceae bacterium]
MKFDLSDWPQVDLRRVRSAFREIPLNAYPELSGYSRADIHEGLAGQGGLFLASDMAKLLALKRGMRVLDLGCGEGATSIFLARNFGVRVFAVDEDLPDSLPHRASRAGVGALVTPVRADARKLPFAHGFFDAVFSMNAFFYFGTDDLYPPRLMRVLKDRGELVIGGPCYRAEIGAETPDEFLLEFPDCLAVHSPGWWRRHLTKTREAQVLHSELHPRGAEFWEDRVRFLLETQRPAKMRPGMRNMVHAMIRMLNRDADGFVSHFMLHARKRGRPDSLPRPTRG